MSWCSVKDCYNSSKKNKDATFHSLPSDEKTRKHWVKMINRTQLPKQVFVCSDHFQEECYDQGWKLQAEMMGKKIKRRLLPGSIPTVFPYKVMPKERPTSSKRKASAEQRELR